MTPVEINFTVGIICILFGFICGLSIDWIVRTFNKLITKVRR